MEAIRIVDVTDGASYGLTPPCADPGFDHQSCDYWEDAERGSKAARASWLERAAPDRAEPRARPGNPFADPDAEPLDNPFLASRPSGPAVNPFAFPDDDLLADNPFAPQRPSRPTVGAEAPRKLALLGRGLAVFGSYAKVLLADDAPAAYAQFGPLSAYPRALRLRELYPQLPDAPLPAVITCIATTREGRGHGHAHRLVEAVCDDLAQRGFAAVEAYPEVGARPEATSGATPGFWLTAGFSLAVDDEHFPVVRRELG
jgi:ribosomal protein S18 acetylase RimI-like enzyme